MRKVYIYIFFFLFKKYLIEIERESYEIEILKKMIH